MPITVGKHFDDLGNAEDLVGSLWLVPIIVSKHFDDLGNAFFFGGAGLVNFLVKASDRRESGNASALENDKRSGDAPCRIDWNSLRLHLALGEFQLRRTSGCRDASSCFLVAGSRISLTSSRLYLSTDHRERDLQVCGRKDPKIHSHYHILSLEPSLLGTRGSTISPMKVQRDGRPIDPPPAHSFNFIRSAFSQREANNEKK